MELSHQMLLIADFLRKLFFEHYCSTTTLQIQVLILSGKFNKKTHKIQIIENLFFCFIAFFCLNSKLTYRFCYEKDNSKHGIEIITPGTSTVDHIQNYD